MAAPKEDPTVAEPSNAREDAADMAQAYRDLTRGEQTAAALEANLTNLEGKLDAILAALEADIEDSKNESKTDRAKETKTENNDSWVG